VRPHGGGVEDQDVEVRVTQGREERVPATGPGPAVEASPDTIPVTEALGQVAPRHAGAGDVQDRVDEAAVVLRDATVLPGLAKTEAKAGEAFTVTAAATPSSFKEDRKVAVALALVNARNIEISSVRVQVWSGLAPTTFLEALGPARWLLVGVVMLVLWWFWFKR